MRAPTGKEKLLALFFPSTCYCCGEAVDFAHHLCPACEASLQKQRVSRAKDVSRGGVRYSIRSVYFYQDAAEQAVKRLKYCNSARASKYMGEAVAEKVRRARRVAFDAVTYVPMYWAEASRRAYNPAEQIARYAGKHLGVPVRPLLTKTRKTEKQHCLSASRRRVNVTGAFETRGDVRGKRILLIDDIVTTGSTLCECAGTLLRGGAAEVTMYTFCAAGGTKQVDTNGSLRYNNQE